MWGQVGMVTFFYRTWLFFYDSSLLFYKEGGLIVLVFYNFFNKFIL